MPRRSSAAVFALFVAGLVAGPAIAQTTEPSKLKVGDPAPPLTPGAWLKGEPVAKLETGKVYVVEFWATWCAPCREAMPHLTALAKKHPDVTFIGQDVFEEDDSVVKPFVARVGDDMGYHVAADDKAKVADGAMQTAWLAAAGISTIPTTFLVGRDGKIAWVGHPMELEPVLDQVLAGTYDVKAAAEKEKKLNDLQDRVNAAAANKDMDGMLKATKELVALDSGMAEPVAAFEFNVLLKNGRTDDARARAQSLSTTSGNPVRLNSVAWLLAGQPQPTADDLKIARVAADRAFDLTDHKEPAIFDTSARVYAAGKDWDKAVAEQQKAIGLATDADLKSAMQKTLEAYQKHAMPAPAGAAANAG